MNKQVSILIPTFNRAEHLVQAVNSALAQTVRCEVIVVDHGSSDGTPQTVKRFGDRIRYIRMDHDLGPHFSWLHGALVAKGDVIKMLFDDDTIEPDFIEKTLPLLTDNVGFVFTAARVFSEDVEPGDSPVLFRKVFHREGVFSSTRHRRRVERLMISPGATLLRRADLVDALYQGRLPFEQASYFGVGPDYFATLLCLLRYRAFGYIPDPLANFRSHGGSITVDSQKDSQTHRLFQRSYREVANHYHGLRFSRNFRFFWDGSLSTRRAAELVRPGKLVQKMTGWTFGARLAQEFVHKIRRVNTKCRKKATEHD